MPIFMWGDPKVGNTVEVGPSNDGTRTFLAVRGTAVWIKPEWAEKVAAALLDYAAREQRGEKHHVVGG
jgi:hypothetical protein